MARYTTWALQKAYVENVEIPDGDDISGSTAKFVLWAIQSFGHDEGWPSIGTLAAMTQLSDRVVRRAIQHLAAHQLVEVTPRVRENGSTQSNLYRVRYDTMSIPPDATSPPPCHSVTPPPDTVSPLEATNLKLPLKKDISAAATNAGQTMLDWATADGLAPGSAILDQIARWEAQTLPTLPIPVGRLKDLGRIVGHLRAKGTAFKNVRYASECVAGAYRDWTRTGHPPWEANQHRHQPPVIHEKLVYGNGRRSTVSEAPTQDVPLDLDNYQSPEGRR